MTRRGLLAAVPVTAAGLLLGAAKCATGDGLPVKTRNAWLTELGPNDLIVFGPVKPAGVWEKKGSVRGTRGRIKVWVQYR